MLKKLLQGIFLGVFIVLPGMSGGTAFLILGIYKKVLRDFASLNLKPYAGLGMGAVIGVASSVMLMGYFFEKQPTYTLPLILGALWGSAPLLLKENNALREKSLPLTSKFLFLLAGAALGWTLGIEPPSVHPAGDTSSYVFLLLAGVIASSTMLIPGISGSAVLIVLGVYGDLLLYLRQMEAFPLLFFGAGCIGGLLGLPGLVLKLFHRSRSFFSFFVAGLILGSGRALFPEELTLTAVILTAAGFLVVAKWGGKSSSRS